MCCGACAARPLLPTIRRVDKQARRAVKATTDDIRVRGRPHPDPLRRGEQPQRPGAVPRIDRGGAGCLLRRRECVRRHPRPPARADRRGRRRRPAAGSPGGTPADRGAAGPTTSATAACSARPSRGPPPRRPEAMPSSQRCIARQQLTFDLASLHLDSQPSGAASKSRTRPCPYIRHPQTDAPGRLSAASRIRQRVQGSGPWAENTWPGYTAPVTYLLRSNA